MRVKVNSTVLIDKLHVPDSEGWFTLATRELDTIVARSTPVTKLRLEILENYEGVPN